jgi:hypothetical protein
VKVCHRKASKQNRQNKGRSRRDKRKWGGSRMVWDAGFH